MKHDPEPDEAVEEAIDSVDALTADLVDQLDALRGRLQESSAHGLADALEDLQDQVRRLLAADTATLGSAALDALGSIAVATDRIERVRVRLVDELSPSMGAEAALRNWTRSRPGDSRVRPDSDT